MPTRSFSRRQLLRGAAATAGWAGAAWTLGGRPIGRASAEPAPEEPALLFLHMHGGYNAMLKSGDYPAFDSYVVGAHAGLTF